MDDWQPFDGAYEKQWYDVRTPTGVVVKHCWPNAGYMSATDGSGRFWKPGDCEIRVSETHPAES